MRSISLSLVRFSITLEIEKVKLSVKGNSKNIKVMIDSMKLDPPQSL